MLGTIMTESMEPTFSTVGDAMEPGHWFNRIKYVHCVGVVGKVKFVSAGGHPFTGVFRGADHGIIRLSAAMSPDLLHALSPGFGIKFLRDGIDSANTVSVASLDGTPGNWNFYSKSFWTQVKPGVGIKHIPLTLKFATATDNVFGVSV